MSVFIIGYVFTENISQMWRIVEKVEFGIVVVNEGLPAMPEAIFGGWKESGLGREGGKYGIEDYLEIKYVCMGGLD
jgi:acyl-CoA reductase-like NAD-dependent aldehyde dehydrogenase